MIMITSGRSYPAYITLLVLLVACNSQSTSPSELQTRPVPAFTDVTESAGLIDFQHDNGARGAMYFPEQMGSGGGFMDYDDDGWLDIILVGGGSIDAAPPSPVEALQLYKNNRDGTFSAVTEQVGLSGLRAYGKGIVTADYDNDGDEDIFFTTLRQNYLFRNDNGVFSDVSEQAGVTGNPVWSSSALFFDADRDGDLDLYVANYAEWSPEKDIFCSIQGIVLLDTRGAKDLEKSYGRKVYCAPNEYKGIPSSYYQNNGDGTFTDQTKEAGFYQTAGKSLGVAEFDFNSDGWPDVFVTNDAEPDLLYKNNGDGTFTEIGQRSGVAHDEIGKARAGMGIDVGVVDQSGRESIFIGNFSSETIGVYKYAGDDLFTDRAAASRIGPPTFLTLTFGLVLFDIEYDGDLDMLTANGHVWAVRPTLDGSTYRQQPQLFINDGQGIFAEHQHAPNSPLAQALVARGASYGDYDKDGDLDVLFTENGGPVHLWRNELRDANYLRVHLAGTTSNKEGLSTQLTAVVGKRRSHRRIRSGSSYLSQSEKVAAFGLGAHTQVDSLLIHWPSGQVDILTDLTGNQDIMVTEGTGVYDELPTSR